MSGFLIVKARIVAQRVRDGSGYPFVFSVYGVSETEKLQKQKIRTDSPTRAEVQAQTRDTPEQ